MKEVDMNKVFSIFLVTLNTVHSINMEEQIVMSDLIIKNHFFLNEKFSLMHTFFLRSLIYFSSFWRELQTMTSFIHLLVRATVWRMHVYLKLFRMMGLLRVIASLPVCNFLLKEYYCPPLPACHGPAVAKGTQTIRSCWFVWNIFFFGPSFKAGIA